VITMSVSRCVQIELAAEVRRLLADVPPAAASDTQWADWFAREAAVLDIYGASEPSLAVHIKDVASTARYEARRLTHRDPY
jgi:hypothetical protein